METQRVKSQTIDKMEAQRVKSQTIEVLEAHSEAVFSEVLEAAAKFNVCRQLEACVWHQLYLRTWHGLPAIR